MAVRWLGASVIAIVALSVACGDDDDDHDTPCDRVCSCVVDRGGDPDFCYSECRKTVEAGGNQRASCLIKLGLFGVSQCNETCDAFPTSS
jgi:hypothetical protein